MMPEPAPRDGALYGFLPGLASGYGLSYPDRTTWKGRLRTVALGSAGGLLTVLALRLAADRNPPVYALWSGRGRLFRGPALWGTGVGLMSAFCRALRPSLPVSVPRIARSGQRVPARDSGWPSASHSRSPVHETVPRGSFGQALL